MDKSNKFVWFITGSQHLYGEETLREVANHSKIMTDFLSQKLLVKLINCDTVKTSEEITKIMKKANADDSCIGIITWMHTFSPSKMWINGLTIINKPILHLHTQFNRELPFDTIDMDFMNLNQSAHGDREHGAIYAKMRKSRKVVAGYWEEEKTIAEINTWIGACLGFDECHNLKVCRFGDNMRDVAVTDGDKVSAEIKFGFSTNYYAVGDLVSEIDKVSENEINALMAEYQQKYTIITTDIASIREQAKYEIAIKKFMDDRSVKAFTTNFEDLYGLKQLPGLAAQRLMGLGYGFSGEGDWKTAAMLRIMKVMSQNTATAFMEDYTYHLEKGNEMILGAHMLEVCPTVAQGEIKIDVKPLGIGGKEPPARMLFDGKEGSAIVVSLLDMGNRFRLLVQKVECQSVPHPMPSLPVAGVMWRPLPNFYDGIKAWIIAGGAHHTVLSYALTAEHMLDFARMAGIECVVIDENTDISQLEDKLLISDFVWNKN